jgi:hypothetical protein
MAENNKSYVSGISLLDTRDILPKVVDIQNTIGLTDVMNAFGRYKPTTQTIYHNYVNKPLWVVGVSTGTITGSGGTAVSGALTAGTSGNARLGDMARFTDGSVGYVSALTPGASDSFTITSVDGTNLIHTTGQNIVFFSNAAGESGGARSNQRRDLTKYYNLIQIFSESNEESDLNRMTTTEVEWDGVNKFCQKDLIEKYLKLKAEVNAAFLQGKISPSQFTTSTSQLLDPVGGGIMQFTRGLDQYIASYGVSDQTDVLGTFDADDLAQFIDLMIAKKSDLNFMMAGSTSALQKWDDYWKGVNSSGVVSANLSVDGQELNLRVDKVTYGAAEIQKTRIPMFDHPEVVAADIKKNLYFIPTGKVKAQSSREGATAMENRIQVRYMKNPISHNQINQGNDIWAEYHSGAASPVTPSGRTRNWATDWVTYQGLEVLGAEQFGKLKVIS